MDVTEGKQAEAALQRAFDEFDALAFALKIAADAGLRAVFELAESIADALPVRFADTLIASDQRGERERFGRGKGRLPSRRRGTELFLSPFSALDDLVCEGENRYDAPD
jgi:hypothetical protein